MLHKGDQFPPARQMGIQGSNICLEAAATKPLTSLLYMFHVGAGNPARNEVKTLERSEQDGAIVSECITLHDASGLGHYRHPGYR